MPRIKFAHRIIITLTPLFCFIAAILLIFGCSSASSNKLTIEDATGETQVLDQPIDRVCSSHNPTMNNIVALGGGGKYVVGFSYKDKGLGLYERVIDNFNDIPSVWDNKNIDIEAVKKMNAQLCFIPEGQTKVIDDFAQAGVKCFISSPVTESFSTVKDSLVRIAKILDCEERANLLNNEYQKIIDDAKTAISGVTDKPSVLFLHTKLNIVYTGGSLQNSIIESAGGINLAKDFNTEEQSATISDEQIVSLNPDVIWVPNYASYKPEDITNNPALSNVNAVKNGKVFLFPCNLEPWDYATPSSCLGVCWAAYNLHPNLYTKDRLLSNCNEFYKLVYNQTFIESDFGI